MCFLVCFLSFKPQILELISKTSQPSLKVKPKYLKGKQRLFVSLFVFN